ncbi:MAG: MotA/TolQ/ExbB proton channel family protein [Candidatus Krumholzibacteria bacterium]|nr:MotA/TolQ/ExbB proton channel family protein [Candidatus Krumholzibacteria bacterium]
MTDAFWFTVDYFRQGGWIMLPLVVTSVVLWTMIVDRMREFAVLGRGDLDRKEAIALVSGKGTVPEGHTLGLRARLVREFLQERSGVVRLDKKILSQVSLQLQQSLDARLAAIAVLAAVAPLLGLLGTVLGMIETFEVISVFGTGNSRAMASGISIALITTQTGLLVAIPGLLMSNRLNRTAQTLKTNLHETTAVLARHLAEGAES